MEQKSYKNWIKSDWQTLIILDACRYDTLKGVYKRYLKGDLYKAVRRLTTAPTVEPEIKAVVNALSGMSRYSYDYCEENAIDIDKIFAKYH